jgi:hypothetical protein
MRVVVERSVEDASARRGQEDPLKAEGWASLPTLPAVDPPEAVGERGRIL